MLDLVAKDDPILRKKAQPAYKLDQEIILLIDELFKKLETLEGVGLAAPQVGHSIALAVIEYTRKKEDEDKEVSDIPKTALINPVITWRSREMDIKTEACFSLPKTEIDVPRHKKIHLEYLNEQGKKKKIKAKGFLARAIQHEIDHLNGILITDYS